MRWTHFASVETVLCAMENGVVLFETDVTVEIEYGVDPDDGSLAAWQVRCFEIHKYEWTGRDTATPKMIIAATCRIGRSHIMFSVLDRYLERESVEASLIENGDFPETRSDCEEHRLF